MISINVICVGSLKEDYLVAMQNEYTKRLSKYCKLNIITIKDEKLPTTLNNSNMQIVKDKEGIEILKRLNNKNEYNIVLDEHGKEYSSIELSEKLQNISTKLSSTINFVIGGSLGLSEEVKEKAHEIVSFSKLTFPHQMIRMFLLEQLFRSFKIINNETYHH